MSDRRVPPAAVELERLLARRRALASGLLSLDMYDRWGARSDEDHRRTRDEMATLDAEQAAVVARLEARVAELRTADPEAVIRWAEAHLALLDAFLARAQPDSTEAFVARGERQAWEEVRAGTRARVEENVYFVAPERALYAELFGLDPTGDDLPPLSGGDSTP